MDSNNEQKRDIAPDQSWEIDLFKPEDAEGVTSLFLEIYGRDYPVKKFIDPQLLTEENLAGRVVSSVARTSGGDVVGHNAVFNSAYWTGVFESGAGVVHRHYRGPDKKIFVHMVEHGHEYLKTSGRGCGMFCEPLCSHVISQRLTKEQNIITRALEVDLIPGTTYSKEKKLSGRVSTLLDFITIIPRPHRVYIPEVYRDQLDFCYQALDDEREFVHQGEDWPSNLTTEIKTMAFEAAGTARLPVLQAGPDFGPFMDREEARLKALGIVTIQVWLNLTWPWVEKAVDELRRRDFFFGGLLPRWFDDDGLLMQKIQIRPNWEGVNLLYDRGKELFEMVKKDWAGTR
ncbi:MAG: hypothetical protein V1816_24175 [Pseudomonadota bacterium]